MSENIPSDPSSNAGYGWWWWGPWYEHQNLRDDRAEAFTTYLWDGVYDYSYVARATTPGEFVVPPAKAEEMYSPEVFGRSGSDRVVIGGRKNERTYAGFDKHSLRKYSQLLRFMCQVPFLATTRCQGSRR